MQTFTDWICTPCTPGQRIGQHLMNTAPEHIYKAAAGDAKLDCFFSSYNDASTHLFIQFAELAWDVTDENELAIARELVLDSQ